MFMSTLTWGESDELRRLREGDASAMGEIFDRYADRVKYYILRQPSAWSYDIAEEVTLDAFIKFMRRSRWKDSAYKELTCIGGYLVKTALNLLIDHVRKVKRNLKVMEKLAAVPVLPPLQPEQVALSNETLRLVDEAVDNLPPLYQPTVRHALEGCGVKEIAELTGASEDTARKRRNRALKLLRAALRAHVKGTGGRSQERNDNGRKNRPEVTQ